MINCSQGYTTYATMQPHPSQGGSIAPPLYGNTNIPSTHPGPNPAVMDPLRPMHQRPSGYVHQQAPGYAHNMPNTQRSVLHFKPIHLLKALYYFIPGNFIWYLLLSFVLWTLGLHTSPSIRILSFMVSVTWDLRGSIQAWGPTRCWQINNSNSSNSNKQHSNSNFTSDKQHSEYVIDYSCAQVFNLNYCLRVNLKGQVVWYAQICFQRFKLFFQSKDEKVMKQNNSSEGMGTRIWLLSNKKIKMYMYVSASPTLRCMKAKLILTKFVSKSLAGKC